MTTDKPPKCVKVLCKACFNCTLDPLPREATGKNIPRLHTCKVGKFASIEEHRLPRFDLPGSPCAEFDGDTIEEEPKKKTAPKKRYINLSECLPASMIRKIQLQAPWICGREVYLPSPDLSSKENARVLKIFRRCQSIRKTAKLTGLHRDTVRLHLDRELQKLMDADNLHELWGRTIGGGDNRDNSSTIEVSCDRKKRLRDIDKLRRKKEKEEEEQQQQQQQEQKGRSSKSKSTRSSSSSSSSARPMKIKMSTKEETETKTDAEPRTEEQIQSETEKSDQQGSRKAKRQHPKQKNSRTTQNRKKKRTKK